MLNTFFKAASSRNEFATLFFNLIKQDYLDNKEYKNIFKLSKLYFNKYKKFPTKKELIILINNSKKITQKQETITILEDIFSTDIKELNINFIKEELFGFIKSKALVNTIEDLIKKIESNKNINLDEVKQNILSSLNIDFEDENELLDYSSDIENRIKNILASESRHIELGFSFLDKIIKVKKKSILLIGAATGVGKSIFLSNLAVNALKQNKNVLYITLELPSLLVSKRFDSIVLDISTETVFNNPDYVIKELKKIKNMGRLFIKEYPPSMSNMYMIDNVIEQIMNKYNVTIDVLVIDYATYLNPIVDNKNINSYERYKQVMKEMSSVTKERKLITYTAGQINREGYHRKIAKNFDFSDSIELPRISDVVLTLNPLKNSNNEYKYLEVFVAKNREGVENISSYVKMDRNSLLIKDVDETDNLEIEDDNTELDWFNKE